MKIAFIGQKGLPAHSGGVERHVDDIATCLAADGHKIIAYCRRSYVSARPIPKTYQGVRLLYVPTIPSKHFETVIQTVVATFHALFVRDLDIIHYHGIGPSLFAWIPRILKPGTRVIATFHSQDYYGPKWGVLARLAFQLGEFVACTFTHETIAVSRHIAEYVHRAYGMMPTLIPNAVRAPTPATRDALKTYGLEYDSYILCVARLVKHKGIHRVIEAYRDLPPLLRTQYRLVIVGESCHTLAYARELHALAAKDPRIQFLGEVSGEPLSALYANAKVFVQVSEQEGLSYTLLEAMSHGTPVLVSDIAAHREVLLTDAVTFRVGDAQALRTRLSHILEDDTSARIHAQLHQAHVRERYSLEMLYRQMLAVYEGHSALARHGFFSAYRFAPRRV